MRRLPYPNVFMRRPLEFHGVREWDRTRGLVAWFPIHDPILLDVIGGVRLLPQSSPGAFSEITVAGSVGGPGYLTNAASEGMDALTPAHLKLTLPLTIAAWFFTVGTPDANAGMFAVVPNNTDTTPFISYGIYYTGSAWAFYGNSAGSTITRVTSINHTLRQPTLIVATITSAATAVYVNGVLAHSGAGVSNPTYAATSRISIGNYTGVTRNSNQVFIDGKIWNRDLTAFEVKSLYDDPWGDYLIPRRTSYGFASAQTFQPAWALGSNVVISPLGGM